MPCPARWLRDVEQNQVAWVIISEAGDVGVPIDPVGVVSHLCTDGQHGLAAVSPDVRKRVRASVSHPDSESVHNLRVAEWSSVPIQDAEVPNRDRGEYACEEETSNLK